MKEIVKKYEDKKILVTEGAGCIGSNLVKRFSKIGVKEIVILSLAYTERRMWTTQII